jgi:hypothetical protein
MEVFHVSLMDPIGPAFLYAIADHWKSVRLLLLQRNVRPQEWTEELEGALVAMVQQLPKLTHFTCVDSDTPPYLEPEEFQDYNRVYAAFIAGTSPLRLLWVPHLSTATLSTVLALCPDLVEILHTFPPEQTFLHALAATRVKSVGFVWSVVSRDCLEQFRDLEGLVMWDIGPGAEQALASLAARSPWLNKLILFFNQRPSLCLFLDMLRYTPALHELTVEGPPPQDRDYDEDAEDDEDEDEYADARGRSQELDDLIQDAKKAMYALVRALCPACRAMIDL